MFGKYEKNSTGPFKMIHMFSLIKIYFCSNIFCSQWPIHGNNNNNNKPLNFYKTLKKKMIFKNYFDH